MRQTLINKICANKFHISVLIDESTNLNRLSCLVVYVRATVDIDVGPVTFFLDLVEIEATDANGIVAALPCVTWFFRRIFEGVLGGSCSRWCVSDAGK